MYYTDDIFSKPLRLLYSLIIYGVVGFLSSLFTLCYFFLYLKSVPIYVIVHVLYILSKNRVYMYVYIYTCTCIQCMCMYILSRTQYTCTCCVRVEKMCITCN